MASQADPTTLAAIKDAVKALKQQRDYLGDFMFNNASHPEYFRAKNLDEQASSAIAALNGKAMQILGANTAKAVADLKEVTADAKNFIKEVQDIKRGLKVVASFLVLAGSLMIGDAEGVITAAKGVKEALGPPKEDGEGAAGPAAAPATTAPAA